MKDISPALLAPLARLDPLTDAQARTLSFLLTASYVGSLYATNLFASRASAASINGKGQKQVSKVSSQTAAGESSSGVAVPPVSATDQVGHLPSAAESRGRAQDETDDAPRPGDRDHPDTIRRRVMGVSVATGLSMGAVWYVVAVQGLTSMVDAIPDTLTLLGLAVPNSSRLAHSSTSTTASDLKTLGHIILPYALAPSMLFGPLYAMFLDGDLPLQGYSPRDSAGQSTGILGRIKRWNGGWTWIEGRNYIAGPVTEELVFRSSLLATAILARQSPNWLVFGSPLYFGIAHAHHAWNVFSKLRKDGAGLVNALIPAVAGCVFQLTYTSLFGFFASYTHIRTGSVLPAVASHVFCNIMGIYLPHAAIARHPSRRMSIWLAYLGGIAGFIWGIRRL